VVVGGRLRAGGMQVEEFGADPSRAACGALGLESSLTLGRPHNELNLRAGHFRVRSRYGASVGV
jgi:hypothetical protein